MLESRLRELGGVFSSVADFTPHVVVDGNLITGQNPASSKVTVAALLKFIAGDL